MADVARSGSWREELVSLVDDGIRYSGSEDPLTATSMDDLKQNPFNFQVRYEDPEPEDLKEQIKGFAKAWGELLVDLSRGCKDIVQQSLVSEDSYLVKKFGPSVTKVSSKLSFLNEYLPEDRDPVQAWPVIFFVFVLALAGNFSFAPCVASKFFLRG